MENTVLAGEQSRAVTIEDALKMLQETRQIIREMGAETDRKMQETFQRMKETDRKIGKLGSRLGEIIEHIMSPKLHEKFEKLGYRFNHTSRHHEIVDSDDKRKVTEVDILLENGDYVMAVEVKTRLSTPDVKDHIKRMERLRRVADAHHDRRKYMGAVAGAVVDKRVLAHAVKSGFFVITPSGETVDIEAPEGGKPRIW
ncbi:MAG: hypothetical protein LBH51_00635 [Treponema sp.]|nr:hypothetical protein [Treponema sp.]